MKGTARRVGAARVCDQRVLGAGEAHESPLDLARFRPIPETDLAHVEEVTEDDRSRRAPDRPGQRLVVVRVPLSLADERAQPPISDTERVDCPAELPDEPELRVLVGLREANVEPDHLRAVLREDVDERCDLGPGPGPSSFHVQALLVDDHERHRRRGPKLTARTDAHIVGLELEQVEDRHADGEQRADEEHRQRGRSDDEKMESHSSPIPRVPPPSASRDVGVDRPPEPKSTLP